MASFWVRKEDILPTCIFKTLDLFLMSLTALSRIIPSKWIPLMTSKTTETSSDNNFLSLIICEATEIMA